MENVRLDGERRRGDEGVTYGFAREKNSEIHF